MGDKQSKNATVVSPNQDDFDLLLKNSHFTLNELQKLYDEFNQQSKGTKGGLDKKKFGEALEKIGLLDNVANLAIEKGFPEAAIKQSLIDDMFPLFDRDGNGVVDFEEFVGGASIMLKGSEGEKYEAIFRWRDHDGDGRLSRQELFESIKYTMNGARNMINVSMKHLRKTKGTLGAKQVQKTMDQLTSDESIRTIVNEIFEQADDNGDGQISFAEFREFVDNNPSWLDIFKMTNPNQNKE